MLAVSTRFRRLRDHVMKRAATTRNKRRAKAARTDSGDGCGSTSIAAADVLQDPDVLELILASLAYSDLRQRASVSSWFADGVRRVLRCWRVLDERSCRSEGFLGTATHVAMAPAWLELRNARKIVQRVLSVPAGNRFEPPLLLPLCDVRAQHVVPPPPNAARDFRPTGLIFCGHDMFVSDRNGSVHKYRLSLSPSSSTPISQHLAQTPRHALGAAEGLCCVGARLYVCDRENNCMVAFDCSSLCELFRFGESALLQPTAVIARGGELFVAASSSADRCKAAVSVFDLEGVLRRTMRHTLLGEARGLAFVRDHLVVAEYDSRAAFAHVRASSRLLCFTLSGELRQVLEDTSWRGLFGCAVDARGDLHVVDTPVLKVRILQPVA